MALPLRFERPTADGTPVARNVALLRSELRRWAIRNPVRG